MAAQRFIETLLTYGRKRLVRVVVALLILAGAIYVQYRVANIPLPVDVEKSKPPYTPATAALIKREGLVIDTPAVDKSSGDAAAGFLLSGDGTEFVSVEARFDSAQLGNEIMDLLRTDSQRKALPTQDRQFIVYTAMADEEAAPNPQSSSRPERQEAAPCRTSIDVKLAEGAKPLTELHFFQTEPGSERHREFEMKAVGADLVVELLTRNFTETYGEMQGTDCGKTLAVGNWQRSFTAPVPIAILVPAGTSFRFSFTTAEGKPWSGGGTFYEPFKLVALPVNALALRTITRGASPGTSPLPIQDARSVDGGPPLVLKYFRVGSEELQLDFAGKAMVQENGKYAVTFSLIDFIKGNPILAAILLMLDASLLEWIRRTLFGGSKNADKT